MKQAGQRAQRKSPRYAFERLSQFDQKSPLQRAVNERELRETARVLAIDAAAIGDPRGSVGSEYETEWLASRILLIKCGLIRIATEKNVNAVRSIAGDPDVTLRVSCHSLFSNRDALVTAISRQRYA